MHSSDFVPVSWLSRFCWLSPLYFCRRIPNIDKHFWRMSLQWWIIGRKWGGGREGQGSCLVVCRLKHCKLLRFIQCWYFSHVHSRIIQKPSSSSRGVVHHYCYCLNLCFSQSPHHLFYAFWNVACCLSVFCFHKCTILVAVVKNSVVPQYSVSYFSKKLEPCKFSIAYYYL